MGPHISVIIPVFNDSRGLKKTIDALLHQNYPKELFEIIVVDNGSTDSSCEQAKSMAARHPDRIRVLIESTLRGSYAARNKGIIASRGVLICFIDANVIMSPDFLGKIDDRFKAGSVDYLGCDVRIFSNHETLSSKYQKVRAFKVQWYIQNRKFAPTCCLVVKRSVIDQVGPFDSRLESGGDWEFGRRVHAAGYSQAFSENITVYHPARWRYRDLVKKNQRCARGEAQLHYYFPQEFEDIQGRLLKINKYLPLNPCKLGQRGSKKNIITGLHELLLLSCFHIPLNLIRIFSYISERRRLLNLRSLNQ
jgi:glycosyltransferase involved in cell wall biosynthesis